MIIGAVDAGHERAPVRRPCRAVARRDPRQAKAAGRLVLHEDGSIDTAASDRLRAEATDPSTTRKATAPKLKPVPEAAVSAVGDTLKEQGIAAPATGGGTTFLQAKTAHEVLKAQERRIRLAKLKGELVDRARAETLMFRLARDERDAWVTWPARVAALMASELTAALGDACEVEAAQMQKVLEAHVRAQLDSLAKVRPGLG
jgi:hypothetical protein